MRSGVVPAVPLAIKTAEQHMVHPPPRCSCSLSSRAIQRTRADTASSSFAVGFCRGCSQNDGRTKRDHEGWKIYALRRQLNKPVHSANYHLASLVSSGDQERELISGPFQSKVPLSAPIVVKSDNAVIPDGEIDWWISLWCFANKEICRGYFERNKADAS